MKPMITIENLRKRFIVPHQRRDTLKESFLDVFKKKTYEKFEALSDINLKIEQGDFIGIVGKNGSGKSTLLKIMAGIYQPSEGSVTVGGRIAPFLELGVGFEPELTARENIFVNATLLGLSRKQILEKFHEIVSFAEIEKFLDLKIKNFSSGMKARLAFAIAKEADADIYLCDEILAVGDEQFQQKCLDVFRIWKNQGKTIVFVSHNPAQVEDFCNKAVLIDDGKIVRHGSPSDVLAEYHRRMLVGQDREQQKIQYRSPDNEFENSAIRISGVQFFDAHGDSCTAFKTGDDITIRIAFRSTKEVTSPVFGIAIHKSDGTHISGPNTKTSLYPIDKIQGEGFVECRLKANNLLAGTYLLTVSCFDYSCTCPYDYLDRKYRFTIERNRDNQYGLVELPVSWSLTRNDHA